MIAVVGSLNMDLVINTEIIPRPGETVLGQDFKRVPGGKGGNQADSIARLGTNVTIFGAVGKDDFGRELIASLQKDGVKTDFIMELENVQTGIAAIIVEKSGNNAITVVSGANHSISVTDLEKFKPVIEASNMFLVQMETPLQVVQAALNAAKSYGVFTILNPAPATHLDSETYKNVDILTPNETELEILSESPTSNMDEILIAGRKLIDKGIKELVVTLGENGCARINSENITHYPAYKVKAIDTTAAGDCFNGALAVALSEGKYIDRAIEFAMAASALSVTKAGAQTSLPNRTEVENFIKNNK